MISAAVRPSERTTSKPANIPIRIDWPPRGHGYTEEEIAAVAEVMRASGTAITQGPNVQQFERAFSEYVGTQNAFALMSGAHALDIAAMLCAIEPGDEVIVPAHTYCASAIAFARRGATIKWGDLNPESLSLSVNSIRELTTKKTRAIVLVHLYGLLSPDVEEIAAFARERGIFLVEDCAQALGARKGTRHCGTFGDIGCYSFHGQKNLSTLGEGGMIVARDPEIAAHIPGLRLNGHAPFREKPEYWLPAMVNVDRDIEGVWPMKSTMTEVQAAVGRLVLGRLDAMTEERRSRAMAFRAAMADFPELWFQVIPSPENHSHHLLTARYDGVNGSNRDDLIRLLSREYGVKAIIQYHPLNRYDLFRKSGFDKATVPETNRFFDNMVSFPFSIEMSDDDFSYLTDAVVNTLRRLRS